LDQAQKKSQINRIGATASNIIHVAQGFGKLKIIILLNRNIDLKKFLN
tara:strand:- start:519 stop:662 length:144 start_codon:yes stop_codon:yes gene_type:complete